MKILGFETNAGLRLGLVEGDSVIDLQAVDASLPVNLADVLARNNGDLTPLAQLARRAPAGARKPLKGLKYALPVARPGKIICLGLNYLEHVKEQRENVQKFPTIFMRCQTSLLPHGKPIVRPKVTETLDYEAEMVVEKGAIVLRKPAAKAREGWAEASDRISRAGNDKLVWPEFSNAGDKDLKW